MKNEVKVLFGLGVATASCALLYRYLSKDEFEAAALTKSTQAKKADSIAGAADSFDKEETTALPQAEQQASQLMAFKVAYEDGQLHLAAGRLDQAEGCLRKALAACQRYHLLHMDRRRERAVFLSSL